MPKKLFAFTTGALLAAAFLAGCSSQPNTVRVFMETNPHRLENFADNIEYFTQGISELYNVEMSVFVELAGEHEVVLNHSFYNPEWLAGTSWGYTIAYIMDVELHDAAIWGSDWQYVAANFRQSIDVDTLYLTLRFFDVNSDLLFERTFAGHEPDLQR